MEQFNWAYKNNGLKIKSLNLSTSLCVRVEIIDKTLGLALRLSGMKWPGA
jgi:hypothetical protein